jgi:hypothetical protein
VSRWNLDMRSSSREELLELSIVHYIGWPVALRDPLDDSGARSVVISYIPPYIQSKTYRTSLLLCDRCEYRTGCWPCRANNANMDPLEPEASGLMTFSTASCPKHLRAWYLRFAVEARSFES